MSEALAKKLDAIQASVGIRARELALLLDTTPQTVSRWRSGAVEPHSERLQRLLDLTWLAERMSKLYARDDARLWLFTPHPLLDGARPADRIKEGKLDDVSRVIDQLIAGAYV